MNANSFTINAVGTTIYFTNLSNDRVDMCVRISSGSNFSTCYKFACLTRGGHTEQNIRELFQKFPPASLDDGKNFILLFPNSCFFTQFKIEFIEFTVQIKKICEMSRKIKQLEAKIKQLESEPKVVFRAVEDIVCDDLIDLNRKLAAIEESKYNLYMTMPLISEYDNVCMQMSNVYEEKEIFECKDIHETFLDWARNKPWISEVQDTQFIIIDFDRKMVLAELKNRCPDMIVCVEQFVIELVFGQ
jgi:hypothetical protein